MIDISTYASRYRLKLRRDIDGTDIILGRRGHIYEYDPEAGLLGVCLQFEPGMGGARAYGFARKRFLALGALCVQNGDFEGCLAFDPENEALSRAAIREASVKPRRLLSRAQTEVLRRARAAIGKGAL
jgi:hypothetical protein